jgi:hypothetical protein
VNAASLAFSVQAAAFADVKGPGVTYGDFNGLMQVTFGFDGVQHTPYDPPAPIPPGDPSLPDPTLPSPDVAFSDAIHLTAEGYLILADAQFDTFYAERLLGEAPAVPALGWTSQGLLAALLLGTGTMRRRVSGARPRRPSRRTAA